MSKIIQSTYVQEAVLVDSWAIFLLSLQQLVYVVPNFQLFVSQRCALCRKFLFSLESPALCSDTSKSLIGAEYTKSFRWPHSHKCRALWSGDCVGQLTGLPRPIHSSQKVWSKCCLTMRRKWGGAPSCMHEPNVLLMKRRMLQEYWQIIHQKTTIHCTS
jgi:hypothetical protein